ncbi:MAG TPA: diguanylate cyclase, partial [Usitatibacter sp.]|nr:diguanylate cyclase [Usitatibacter sp.]
MNAAPLARILIVDDESAHLRALCDSLRDQGYETTGFTGGEDALAALREKPFDVLLTDLMMPGMDGVALLAAALKIDPQLAGILMTGVGTIRTAVQAMQAGAMDYVLKPFKVSSLLPTLARALSLRRLRIENLELRDTVAIHELNQAIAHTLDPNVLLDRIADAVLAQFEADEASVMLLDDDGRSLRVAAVRGEGRESLLGARVAVGQGIAGWVAAHREPLVLQGEVLDPRVEPLRRRPEIRSALSMPMVARGKLIGVLNVNYIRRPRAFAIGQTRVLAIFTNAAAVGIEAARLHDGQRKADLRYREVLDMAADGIISLDSERRVVVFNRGAERIFGYRAAEVIGGPLEMFLPAEALEARLDAPGSLGAGPGADRPAPSHRRLFGRRKDGTPVNVEMAISERSESGMTLYTAVVRDITQRVQQEERIARLTRLYTVLSGVNSAIVRIADESGLFAEICRVGTQAGGFMAACVGMPDRDRGEMKIAAAAGVALEATGATAATSVAVELAERAIREQAVVWDNDLAARNSVGSPREDAPVPRAHAAAALPFVLGEAVHAVMMLYADAPGAFGDEEVRLLRDLAGDVSFALDHIAKTRQVDYLATHDQLTGLPNRTLFVERLAQALATAKRDAQPLAVVLADIERFKRVNDTFGRQAGDALLREVAERLRALVEDGASLARVGPDVFATIWGRFAQPAGLARIVRERGDRAMDASFEADGQALRLALRFGVAFFPGDGADTEALFRNAEAALRRAKARHERLAFYTPELNARVAQQLSLESKLRRALERDEFVLHFQPKVDLGTGGIAGFEALVRWRDAESGRL